MLPTQTMGPLTGASLSGQPLIELTVPLGDQREVYDAELRGIQQAAEECSKQLRLRRRKVWIFTDNQAAVHRISTLKPGPGQGVALAMAHIASELELHADIPMGARTRQRHWQRTSRYPR